MTTTEALKQFRHEASKLVALRVRFNRLKSSPGMSKSVIRNRREYDEQLNKVKTLATNL
jgi:hypothetical protein